MPTFLGLSIEWQSLKGDQDAGVDREFAESNCFGLHRFVARQIDCRIPSGLKALRLQPQAIEGPLLDSCFRLLRHAEMKLGHLFEGFPRLENRCREGGLVRRIGIMLSFQAECFVHFVVGVARISR